MKKLLKKPIVILLLTVVVSVSLFSFYQLTHATGITHDHDCTGTSSTASVNCSLNPSGGTNGIIMIIATANDSNGTGFTATWGGNSATLITQTSTSFGQSSIFYYIDSSSGSKTCAASGSGNQNGSVITCSSFYGVAQSNPIDTSTTQLANDNLITMTMTSNAANELLYGTGGNGTAGTVQTETLRAGPTEVTGSNVVANGVIRSAAAYQILTTAQSYTVAWDMSDISKHTGAAAILKAFVASTAAPTFLMFN